MPVQKDIHKIEKKLIELEKSITMFEKEEFIERGTCKRNIRRKNMLPASKSATKCIELSRKSHVYTVICQRLRSFLVYLHEHLDEDMIPLVQHIQQSLSDMRFDLLELHLDTFEQFVSKKETPDFVKDSEITESAGDLLDTISVENKKLKHTFKGKSSSKKPFYSERTHPNKENCLIMYKIVPHQEIEAFLSKMSVEVAEEDRSFMYRKPSTVENT